MPVIELWSARIPIIGFFADHHWLVIHRNDAVERWEIWQTQNAGGQNWGHLHRNLKSPQAGVGNGPGRCLYRWDSHQAERLARRIDRSTEAYPWLDTYGYWPGPNSNTFVQWVLRDEHDLNWRAPGKRYARKTLRLKRRTS